MTWFAVICLFVSVCGTVWLLVSSIQDYRREEKSREPVDAACENLQAQGSQSQIVPMIEFHTEVKGTFYRSQHEIRAAQFCQVGDTLILVPEPTNKYDPCAVKVMTMEGVHIGYVAACDAKVVSSNIDHVSECIITHMSRHDIPFIDIHIKFSTKPCRQPGFIPEEYQCSPEDQMRNLLTKPLETYRYRRVQLFVQDLYERDRGIIARARAARKGDKIILKKGICDDCHPERIDIYFADGTYLGFAEDLQRMEVYFLFENIVDSFVACPVSPGTANRLCVSVIFPKSIKCPDGCKLITRRRSKNVYPEVDKAQELRRSDPLAALNILMPIVRIEKGIEARLECIACLYQLKDWPRRIGMIENTLYRINSLTEADLPQSELKHVRNQVYYLNKQLAFSEKRLESLERKRKKK